MSISTSRENVIRSVAQHSAAELELKVLDGGVDQSGVTTYVLKKVTLVTPSLEEEELLLLLINQQLRCGLFVTELRICYPMTSMVKFISLN